MADVPPDVDSVLTQLFDEGRKAFEVVGSPAFPDRAAAIDWQLPAPRGTGTHIDETDR